MGVETVIIREHHIYCDKCGNDHRREGGAILYKNLAKFKINARKLGWKLGKVCLCPKCLKETEV